MTPRRRRHDSKRNFIRGGRPTQAPAACPGERCPPSPGHEQSGTLSLARGEGAAGSPLPGHTTRGHLWTLHSGAKAPKGVTVAEHWVSKEGAPPDKRPALSVLHPAPQVPQQGQNVLPEESSQHAKGKLPRGNLKPNRGWGLVFHTGSDQGSNHSYGKLATFVTGLFVSSEG